MPQFIALLRGINVGKAKRLPMADLRALLIGLGYEDVSTLLNSGNAVFRAAAGPSPAQHAQAIAAAISAQLGLEVPVVVKSARQLAAVVAENSLAEQASANPSQLLVVFSQDRAVLNGLVDAVEPLIVAPEHLLLGSEAAYLHCARGILASKAGEALLGKGGMAVTSRNWATVLKLQALLV